MPISSTGSRDGGLRFLENADYATTNNVVSLALALESIDIADGDLVLAECDLLVEPEVFSLLLRPGNVALVDTYRTGMDGTVVSVSDGFVSAVHAPHVQGPGFVYADKRKTLNLYRFERGFVEGALRPMVRWYAESVDAGSYYELVLAKLVDLPRQRIAAVEVPPGSWIEVDDPNDLAAARFLFEPDRRAEILDDALGGHWSFEILDFSFMANRYFPTDGMLAAMGHALPELVASYGSRQAVVDRKLAWAMRCRPERVRALAGASQAFPWLGEILPAGRVAVPAPTFGEYGRAFPHAVATTTLRASTSTSSTGSRRTTTRSSWSTRTTRPARRSTRRTCTRLPPGTRARGFSSTSRSWRSAASPRSPSASSAIRSRTSSSSRA